MQQRIVSFLQLFLIVTGLCGLVYIVGQQNLRQGANDPQIQMAQDAAMLLQSGESPSIIVGTGKIDMANSLAPFLIIYDEKGNPLASSAELDGHTPQVPIGALQVARDRGENKVTWQPEPSVRSAVVIEYFAGKYPGFVVAGRSLAQVEMREEQLFQLTLVAYLAIILGLGILETVRYLPLIKAVG